MDSMQGLNHSLPQQSSQARRKQANSELLQAFKAAALSVTQLYKTATSEEGDERNESRQSGYVDALDDLLDFLDARNLGLGDGEGWQVREWATERHQQLRSNSEASEDSSGNLPAEDEEVRGRSASPTAQNKQTPQYRSASVQTDPQVSESNDVSASTRALPRVVPSSETFQFRSPMAMPSQQDVDMNTHLQRSPTSVRVELYPRTRSSTHRTTHHTRPADRTPMISLGTVGHGAGSKRKLPLQEFFDVSGLGVNKDGPGGGKRGRYT